jgi:hypothetical protein
VYGGKVAEDLFARGLCLPSSSFLDEATQGRVIDAVLSAVAEHRPRVHAVGGES